LSHYGSKKKEKRRSKNIIQDGTMSSYHPSTEDWQSYVERLSEYFVANDVGTAVKEASYSTKCV